MVALINLMHLDVYFQSTWMGVDYLCYAWLHYIFHGVSAQNLERNDRINVKIFSFRNGLSSNEWKNGRKEIRVYSFSLCLFIWRRISFAASKQFSFQMNRNIRDKIEKKNRTKEHWGRRGSMQ